MSARSSKADLVGRRGELLAELLLEDLGAEFVARPMSDFGYDYFVGFNNAEGGINIAAVEVKATEGPVGSRFPVQKRLFRRLAHSNIPVLLLVANVKENRLFYAFPSAQASSGNPDARTVSIPLTEIDDAAKNELREQLANVQAAAASGALH